MKVCEAAEYGWTLRLGLVLCTWLYAGYCCCCCWNGSEPLPIELERPTAAEYGGGRREGAREREVELVRIGRVEGVVGRGRVGAVVVEVRWGEPEWGGHGRHVKGVESE